MKEFKFRAWDESGKVMVYFTLQDLVRAGSNNGRLDDGCRVQDLLDPAVPKMQYIGLKDRHEKEVYDDDIVRVYDMEHGCECNNWDQCDTPCEDHETHEHAKPEDCENYMCTQRVRRSRGTGYFCDEDNGEYCPCLGADEIEVEIVGHIYQPSHGFKITS